MDRPLLETTTVGAWDTLAPAYKREVRIREGAFHLGPNGDALDLLAEESLKLSPDSRVLDLGCGAGHNARAVARQCATVTAVDSSSAQIAIAQQLTSAANIDFVEADVVQYLAGCASQSFDVIYGVFSFEYFSDIDSVFHDCYRVLVPGGILLYCDLHPFVSSGDVVCATTSALSRSIAYFREGPRRFIWQCGRQRVELTRHHRTLSHLFAAATSPGFVVRGVHEPLANSTWPDPPYYDPTIESQADVWCRYPYTLVLRMERVSDA